MGPRSALAAFLRSGIPPCPSDAAQQDALLVAAREEGVAGLLHEAVASSPAPDARFLAALRSIHQAWLARGLQQLALVERTRAILRAVGVGSVALKGGAVAERLYDTVGERPMSDVDLLARGSWPAAVAAMAAAGYVEDDRADHAWSYRVPGAPGRVELHRHLTSCGALFPSAEVPVDGPASAELLLVQLALHASFQHGLALSLVQWFDFRRLLEREPVDADELARLAARFHAAAAVGAALRAAEATVGAPLGQLRRLFVDPLPRALARAAARPPSAPLRPRLAWIRWQVARGQRRRLLAATLRSGPVREDGTSEPRPLLPRLRSLARPAPARPPDDAHAFEESVLRDCLAGFDRLRLTVTGDCMRPALHPGDTVVLAPVRSAPPRFGDVVLLRHPAGLRLHRLIWSPPGLRWRTKGDRAVFCDPSLGRADLLATVIAADPRRGAVRSASRALVSLASAVGTRLRVRSAW
ncbi:MAG: nucleotidyltransferase family protein [Vicinamibacteria bacterium]